LPLLLEFGLALLAIVVAAAIFTNAVEILGGRLNLGDGQLGVCSRRWVPPYRRP
jgi:hypothetical protein